MTRNLALTALTLAALLAPATAHAARAKDLGRFMGTREQTLTGVGLVVGLPQTGDTIMNRATAQQLVNRYQGVGLTVSLQDVMSRNTATVSVVARVRSDARSGDAMSVTVAANLDARSLEGGLLTPTLLFGPDGHVYGTAEGALTVGGYDIEVEGNRQRRNVATTARVNDGFILERELGTAMAYNELDTIEFVLDDPDFTTAQRLADAVDSEFGEGTAEVVSAATIAIALPEPFRGKFARFAASFEALDVDPDKPARVVINERTGTVVISDEIAVSPFAISHGGLKVTVQRVNQVVQPTMLSLGTTAEVANTTLEVNEDEGRLVLVEAVNLADLVAGLNTMGVKPRDLASILQAIAAAGALRAEIIVQ